MNFNQWWEDVLNGFECDECRKHFPKTSLVTVDSQFKELAGKFCVVCVHKVFDLAGYCDECGDEYPKKYLFTNSITNDTLCKKCIRVGELYE